MAYTQDDINALDDHIKKVSTGVAVIEYEIRGRRIKYKDMSLEDLGTLRRLMLADVQAATGRPVRRGGIIISSKGL